MTENLHTKLVAVLTAAGVRPALSEEETAVYPYVTFELPCEYRYSKDGLYKIVGNLTIRAVSDDVDEVDSIRESIEAAISGGFNGPSSVQVDEAEPGDEEIVEEVIPEDGEVPAEPEDPDDPGQPEPHDQEEDVYEGDTPTYNYTARLMDVRKDCTDGVWVIELDYILNQYE